MVCDLTMTGEVWVQLEIWGFSPFVHFQQSYGCFCAVMDFDKHTAKTIIDSKSGKQFWHAHVPP